MIASARKCRPGCGKEGLWTIIFSFPITIYFNQLTNWVVCVVKVDCYFSLPGSVHHLLAVGIHHFSFWFGLFGTLLDRCWLLHTPSNPPQHQMIWATLQMMHETIRPKQALSGCSVASAPSSSSLQAALVSTPPFIWHLILDSTVYNSIRIRPKKKIEIFHKNYTLLLRL